MFHPTTNKKIIMKKEHKNQKQNKKTHTYTHMDTENNEKLYNIKIDSVV